MKNLKPGSVFERRTDGCTFAVILMSGDVEADGESWWRTAECQEYQLGMQIVLRKDFEFKNMQYKGHIAQLRIYNG